jgi:hypothetical protein
MDFPPFDTSLQPLSQLPLSEVIVVDAAESPVLHIVYYVNASHWPELILAGNEQKICRLASQMGLDINCCVAQGISSESIIEIGVPMAPQGNVDALTKGHIHSVTVSHPRLSHWRYSCICQVFDADLSTYPRASTITGAMVVNIIPCFAVESGVDVINPVMPSTACLTKLGTRRQLGNAVMDRLLAFDTLSLSIFPAKTQCRAGVSWVMLSQLFTSGDPYPLRHDYYRLAQHLSSHCQN